MGPRPAIFQATEYHPKHLILALGSLQPYNSSQDRKHYEMNKQNLKPSATSPFHHRIPLIPLSAYHEA